MVFFSVRLESHETDEISLQVVVFCKQSIPPPFNYMMMMVMMIRGLTLNLLRSLVALPLSFPCLVFECSGINVVLILLPSN